MRHKRSRKSLDEILKSGKHSVIHYSCESFYERKEGASPCITSIAIRNLDTAQTVSFSIHQAAELNRIPISEIGSKYNELEKNMLDRLSDYLKAHSDQNLLHWNMRDQSYGFSAIEHRHKVLGDDPYIVPDDRKIDLSRLFIGLYSVSYIAIHGLQNFSRETKSSLRISLTEHKRQRHSTTKNM